ncbi:TrkH family potassium uptake protein [Dongshaea marina]|uniref:TrkH family potassium uptake protein n=1 Tax=Dongshaea marina TaxID=2047966 RepID=UPI000D3E5ACE|nr:TrkH family potassium uptake protein [Dongshaea marina]
MRINSIPLVNGQRLNLSPSQWVVSTFLLILLAGASLLSTSWAGHGVSWLGALFTATSAICVTGLATLDIGTHFNIFGQVVIMILVQIGGLGQMTLGMLLLMTLGKRLGLRQKLLLQDALNQDEHGQIFTLARRVVQFALLFEAIGLLLLSIRFVPEMGFSHGVYVALFHVISAFNNAGFSLFPDNMISYSDDPVVLLTISLLIIFGGLGFTVLLELTRTRRLSRMSLHSQLVIKGTLILLILGTLGIWLLEHNNRHTLGALPAAQQWLGAFFQSVSTRTAGFESIDMGQIHSSTSLLMMVLMFIGAGAASTAGGIKVTTFMVLLLATRSFLRHQNRVTFGRKEISQATINKSVAVIMTSLIVLCVGVFALSITDHAPLQALMFEAVSALGTVGLSLDLTPTLSHGGQMILIILMFIGRLGPLTLALTLSKPNVQRVRYPEGKWLQVNSFIQNRSPRGCGFSSG